MRVSRTPHLDREISIGIPPDLDRIQRPGADRKIGTKVWGIVIPSIFGFASAPASSREE